MLCEDHVSQHLAEKMYVGNGAEVRYKFCAGVFGKHGAQRFLPSSWGENAIEEATQFHQKFVRNMFKIFCCQPTFVTSFVDPENGRARTGLLGLCQCGRSKRKNSLPQKIVLKASANSSHGGCEALACPALVRIIFRNACQWET